jgi:hypothetical protein
MTKIIDQTFDAVAVSDNTDVDIFNQYSHLDVGEMDHDSKSSYIHAALLGMGMSPGWGNVADVVDAAIYMLEGEFGEAGWSLASAIPVLGQWAAARRSLEKAQGAGENVIKVYRGIGEWKSGSMVKEGVFVPGGQRSSRIFGSDQTLQPYLYTTINPNAAVKYADQWAKQFGSNLNKVPKVLEFSIPEHYIRSHGLDVYGKNISNSADFIKISKSTPNPVDLFNVKNHEILFKGGLPKGFLTKVWTGKDAQFLKR